MDNDKSIVDEDEIEIDFSGMKKKIGSFFSSDGDKEKKDNENKIDSSTETHKLESDIQDTIFDDVPEETNIDFSGMKKKFSNLFSSDDSKESKDKESKDTEEIAIDPQKIGAFVKNNARWIVPVVLILLSIGVSTYLRAMPAYLPVTDDWATNNVHQHYRSQIENQINAQYPNLPEQNRQTLVQTEFDKIQKEQKDVINQQIQANSNQLKAQFQDESGQTYLLAIDPYLWFTEARNYVTNGHFGTDLVNGEGVNYLRNGREGKRGEAGSALHLYFEVALFKFISFFNSNISLMGVVFWVPVIIIGLSLIPAFLIGRKIAGNMGGFFATFIIAINTALLARTPAGFSDTDPYNILFPVLIMWLFFESFDAKSTRHKLVYGIFGGLVCGLYSTTWGGWWYIFDFIVVSCVLYFIFQLGVLFKGSSARKEKARARIKSVLASGSLFFISSAIFITALSGVIIFLLAFQEPLNVINLKAVASYSVWPNVLTTVAEFNVIPLSTIINQMGGKLLFAIAILGLILTFINTSKQGDRKVLYGILLSIWFVGTAYGFTKGIRFSILMVPAFALSFGAAIGILYEHITNWVSKNLSLNKKIISVLYIVGIFILLLAPIQAAQGVAKSEIPSMNDAWFNTLTKIKDNTQDALITSWWDFGHWFVAISERRVTFDGADQGERIHWVGKSLLTPSEQTSVGILRTLNCGQEKAPHVIEKHIDQGTDKAVDILNKIMVVNDKKQAIKILQQEGLETAQIAEVIAVTYCEDLIDQFYITSEDMVGKAGVWGHFGAWDFTKATMYFETATLERSAALPILQNKFGLSPTEAQKMHTQITTTSADSWISPWPGYQQRFGCTQVKENLECSINAQTRLIINSKTKDASIKTREGIVHPNSIVYATKSGIEEKQFTGNLMGASAILLPGNSVLLSHPLQAKSMFTQLFFFDGHGLKCFEKFDDVRQVTGGRIITWKVDFTCSKDTKIFFQPKEEVNAAHILISTENKDPAVAKQLIDSIKDNLTKANFAQFAQQYSDDTGSKVNGGDLGWFGKNAMVAPFTDTAFAMKKGEISDIVQTQFGYHIIYVKDTRVTQSE